MIEVTVLKFLEARLSVPVYIMEPENPPEQYVTLEKTGSGRSNGLSRATFAVQSYGGAVGGGGSLLEAMELNEQAKAACDALIDLPEISAARLNSDYPFNDEERKRYRCQAVYDVYYYEERYT